MVCCRFDIPWDLCGAVDDFLFGCTAFHRTCFDFETVGGESLSNDRPSSKRRTLTLCVRVCVCVPRFDHGRCSENDWPPTASTANHVQRNTAHSKAASSIIRHHSPILPHIHNTISERFLSQRLRYDVRNLLER